MKILIIISGIVIFSAILLFIFWVSGGFEEYFQPHIEIIIPENYFGLVCATSRPGSVENKKEIARYEISKNRLLEVDGDILRSHRKRKYFLKSSIDGKLSELPDNAMFGIYTEGDYIKKISYSVFWVGTGEEWKEYISKQKGKLVCLNRYNEVN